jgi:uncharacterized protein (TIGR02996 family)
MTTEVDWWALLDKNPLDHQTRAVFADWLQDRDDKRAEGLRWMAEKESASCKLIIYWRIYEEGYILEQDTWNSLNSCIPKSIYINTV